MNWIRATIAASLWLFAGCLLAITGYWIHSSVSLRRRLSSLLEDPGLVTGVGLAYWV